MKNFKLFFEDDFMAGMEEYEWVSNTIVYFSSIQFWPDDKEALISTETTFLVNYLNWFGDNQAATKDEFINDLKTKGVHTEIHPSGRNYSEYTTEKERHEKNLARYKKMAADKKYKLLNYP